MRAGKWKSSTKPSGKQIRPWGPICWSSRTDSLRRPSSHSQYLSGHPVFGFYRRTPSASSFRTVQRLWAGRYSPHRAPHPGSAQSIGVSLIIVGVRGPAFLSQWTGTSKIRCRALTVAAGLLCSGLTLSGATIRSGRRSRTALLMPSLPKYCSWAPRSCRLERSQAVRGSSTWASFPPPDIPSVAAADP